MSHYQDCGDPDFPSAQDGESHTFECDHPECTATHEGGGTFSEVWEDAKVNGWRCFKNDKDEWAHVCPLHRRTRHD